MAASLPASAGEGEPGPPLLRYHASMPAPTNERQALERERDELPGQLAGDQKELDGYVACMQAKGYTAATK